MKHRAIVKNLTAALLSMSLFVSCAPIHQNDAATDGTEENNSTTVSSEITHEDHTETEAISESDTEQEDSSESGSSFTDLSEINSPQYETNNTTALKLTVEKSENGSNQVLRFDGKEIGFDIAPLDINGMHNATGCSACGYKECESETAYYLCNHSLHQVGLLITLKEPLDTSLITGMSMTYRSEKEITTSQMRILLQDETRNDAILNTCPSLAGATNAWKHVDLDLNVQRITDPDGYIRAFKFYFRNKDNTAIYLKDFTFNASPKSLCLVNAVADTCHSRGDALEAVAQTIAARLKNAGFSATLKFKTLEYVPASSSANGSIKYSLTATVQDTGSYSFEHLFTILKKHQNTWLSLSEGTVWRNAREQWKSEFHPSGILTLHDNVIYSPEGIKTMEYAIVSPDTAIDDGSVSWKAPHLLNMTSEGFSDLFVNAAFDFDKSLTEGASYRFLVRGVTENDNYILHLDIPFIYTPLASPALSELENALQAIEGLTVRCNTDAENAEAELLATLNKAVGNDHIGFEIKQTQKGCLSDRFKVSLLYLPDTDLTISLGGEQRADLFNFASARYTVQDIEAVYREQASPITLLAPEDGQADIRITSNEIVHLWNTDADVLATSLYTYARQEVCLPPPVRLEWNDADNGEKYTVILSETKDLSDPITVTTSECFAEIFNLKAGQRYYWQVKSSSAVSEIFTFVTESGYPRFIRTEKVSNFRDIGGLTTLDGKAVKQGLLYRSANLDSVNDSDKNVIKKTLGIVTDLDLRGESKVSPLGSDVRLLPISIKWYHGIYEKTEYLDALRQAISEFAEEENYPMNYHCAIGRDRTGTVTILILGLLGVDEDTILKEYLLSFNSKAGGGDGTYAYDHAYNVSMLLNGLHTYADADAPLKEQVEAFLLYIGITESEIQSIRSILLED